MGLATGTVLGGRWRVLAQLGEGGMGSVYSVADLRQPGSVRALKELLDDGTLSPDDLTWAEERFKAEIALLAQLHHPRIPAFIAQFEQAGRRYFVMEYIPGETLEQRLLRTTGPLPEREVLMWMLGICDALTYLHSRRPPVIVRDLKPGNIMVTPTGEARLIDFGIARTFKAGRAANTENLGTVTYASPEHHGRGQTDARSDIYSLGATLYHLLTGREPAPLETPAPGSLRRLNPRLSAATEEVVIRAMRLDPAARFPSAASLRAALERSLIALPAASRPPARPAALARAPSRAASSASQPASAANASASKAASASASPAASPPPRARPASGASGTAGSPVSGMVRCPRCGHQNRAGAKFCARDGAPLRAVGGAPPLSSAPTSSAPGTTPAAAPVTRVVVAVGSARTQALRASEAFTAGRYGQALQLARAALAQGPNSYDLNLLLGRIHLAMGQPREAAEALHTAATLRPTAEALGLEGAAWHAAGQLTQAQVALTRARQLDPGDVEITRRLGLVCLDQGQLAQAEGELRDGLARHPGHAGLLVALARLSLAQHQVETAINLLQQVVVSTPNDTPAYVMLCQALVAAGRPAEAARHLETASRRMPDRAEIFSALAHAYLALGREAKARQAQRRAAALEPAASPAVSAASEYSAWHVPHASSER